MQEEGVQLVLKSTDLTTYDTGSRDLNKFTFRNVDFRKLLGDMYDEHEEFEISLVSVANSNYVENAEPVVGEGGVQPNTPSSKISLSISNVAPKNYQLYNVYYSSDGSSGSSLNNTTNIITLSGLTSNTAYTIYTTISNSLINKTSSPSSSVIVYTNPATPSITIIARTLTSFTILISSTDSIPPSFFNVFYNNSSLLNQTTNVITITGLNPYTDYNLYASTMGVVKTSSNSNVLINETTNLVLNGYFTDPALTYGSVATVLRASNWTDYYQNRNYYLICGNSGFGNFVYPPGTNQCIGIQSYAGAVAGATQSIYLAAGIYTFSYWAVRRSNQGFASFNVAQTLFINLVGATDTITIENGKVMTAYTGTFVNFTQNITIATAGTYALNIFSTYTATDSTIFITGITLEKTLLTFNNTYSPSSFTFPTTTTVTNAGTYLYTSATISNTTYQNGIYNFKWSKQWDGFWKGSAMFAYDNNNRQPVWLPGATTLYSTTGTTSTTLTVASGANIYGEWSQVEFPYSFCMKNYTIARDDIVYFGAPTSWYWVGSNDGGTTWTVVDYVASANTLTENYVASNISNTNYYTSYRFIPLKNTVNNFLTAAVLQFSGYKI